MAEAGGPVDHVEDAEDDGEDDEAGVVHAHQLHVPRRGAAEGVNAMNQKGFDPEMEPNKTGTHPTAIMEGLARSSLWSLVTVTDPFLVGFLPMTSFLPSRRQCFLSKEGFSLLEWKINL